MLGIIGGMGPQAGLTLFQQVLAHTVAQQDQDHIPSILWSTPDRIPDRTEYLTGKTLENPAYPVADIVLELNRVGVTVVGIACNTFHAPPIWEEFMYRLLVMGAQVEVLHIVEETIRAVKSQQNLNKIGLLSTLGTYKSRLYTNLLESEGIQVIEPSDSDKIRVHDAIYNKIYGIKALGAVGDQAGSILLDVASHLDSEALLLGCTELCLVWRSPTEQLSNQFSLINPLAILANAMVHCYRRSHEKPGFLSASSA
jgi:aspartate racemase